MRSRRSKIAALSLFCIMGLGGSLVAFPFWLESPTRSNPKDPKSPRYQKPAPTLAPTSASINTATYTATPSASPSFSATPTPAGTFTATPTPSPTPPRWYNGESAPYRLADLNPSVDTDTLPGRGAMGITEGSAGGGAQSTANYLKITFSAGSGTWYGRAVLSTNGAPMDLSAYNTLSLWIRIPSGSCSAAFRPAIQLRTSGAWPNDRSANVTATAYLVNSQTLVYDQWIEARIPLSAFVGPNTDGGSFAAGGLSAVIAVVVGAWDGMFATNGSAPSTEIQVDEIGFLSLGSPPSASTMGLMLDDFELPSSTLWYKQAWLFSSDGLPCTPTTSVSFPPPATAPVDAGGNSLSACHAGHMAGYQNTASPCNWTPPLSDPWPLVRMMVDLGPTAMDLSNNTAVGAFPATGAKGLRIRMKKGSTCPGQVYTIQILRSATSADWNNYHFRVADTELSTSWQSFQVDFPPDAQPAGWLAHSADATELFWAQEGGWGNQVDWQRNDFLKLIIRAKVGGNFDVWVDDIEFY